MGAARVFFAAGLSLLPVLSVEGARKDEVLNHEFTLRVFQFQLSPQVLSVLPPFRTRTSLALILYARKGKNK